MENLNQVVKARIESKIAKGHASANAVMEKLKNERMLSQDFIHRVGSSKHGMGTPLMVFLATQAGVNVDLKNSDLTSLGQFALTPHSIRQAGEKLGVPTSYLAQLGMNTQNDWSRNLASHILNEHSMWTEKKRVLVRTVGYQVRGILSDSYRRLDSAEILMGHIQTVYEQGAVISNAFMDETRVYFESILPEPLVIKTARNGEIWLAFGNRWATSDYGDGALEGRSFILNGVCLNGMVRESVMREIHLGSRLPDNLALSEETYRLDSMTQKSAVIDITKRLYSTELIRERMLEIQAATEITVDPERELRNLAGRLLKGETDEIGKILMRSDPNDGVAGESTLWKLANGITAFANNEKLAERRRFELQEVAGELFDRVKDK